MADYLIEHLAFEVVGENLATEWLNPADELYYNNLK